MIILVFLVDVNSVEFNNHSQYEKPILQEIIKIVWIFCTDFSIIQLFDLLNTLIS